MRRNYHVAKSGGERGSHRGSMCLYEPSLCYSEKLQLQRMKDDGGDVGTMNANLPGGLLPSSSTKHAMDLLLFFEVHGVHGVKLHIVSLSVEFSGDGPSMLKLGSGNAGEEAAEILVSAMNGFVGGFLHKGLHFSDECIDISFGAGVGKASAVNRCRSRAVDSSRGRRKASTKETMGRAEAKSFFLLGRM